MKFRAYLRDRYERLVNDSCSEQPFAIPSVAQRYFNNPNAFEYVTAIRKFVGDAENVLIIGDGGGRDYFSLKLLGKRPVVMDIAAQSVIPHQVRGDANAALPFPSATFDAVVMAEVLEHLPQDFQALGEVRRVVKEGGSLILTVPFYQDAEATHVRIHSPASIERLLRSAGWRIADYTEKGGCVARLMGWFPLLMAFHAVNIVALNLRGRTLYQAVNRRIAAMDFWLGRRRHSLHRYSALYGAFIRCTKAAPADTAAENARAFENMHNRQRPLDCGREAAAFHFSRS
jgi:SAM-dependent methyltransferase